MSSQTVLLIGSNLGDRFDNLKRAQKEVKEHIGTILSASSIYETEPWGVSGQPLFYNQAVLVSTGLSPQAVLDNALNIEALLGRKRYEKWGARLLDIDILFYDQLIINTKTLTVPHPHLHTRRFALAPLKEIVPNWIHPSLNKTINNLYCDLQDPLEVRIIEPAAIGSRNSP